MLNKLLGKKGEDKAVEYLKKERYKIIARNIRKKWGEMDIVALDPDGTLVFIEVKTTSGRSAIKGEDQITFRKRQQLLKLAQNLALSSSFNKFILDDTGFRIDVIVLVIEGKEDIFRHYKNCIFI
jgi:putative endonuclease